MHSILIVDDDPTQLTLFRLLLRHLPYAVRTARSAADAFQLMHVEPPDVVLLDIAMPEVSGLQFLEMIRAQPRFMQTKVIVLTAATDRVSQDQAAHIHAVLAKPFELDRLEAALREALGVVT
jgi:CheY-like chemotaxis protein